MRVSVVIPAFEAEATIGTTLHSVLNQTRPAHEIIVVVDGGQDRTAEVAGRFEGVDVIRRENEGAPAARIAGEERATGDALMFLDADDLLGPTALEALTEALASAPEGIAACAWRRYERDGAAWVARPASAAPRRPGHDALAGWLTGTYYPPCALLWSRAAYRTAGGWDRDLFVNQDGDLVMRALASGVPLVETQGGLAYYRRPEAPGGTVSGRAQSGPGIAARLQVLDRLARILDERGRLAAYRPPLAEAYETVAAECPEGEAASRARAQESAQRLGGPAPRRALARRLARGRTRTSRPRTQLRMAPEPLSDSAPRHTADQPLVSVVIPTHNRAHIVGRAIRSVLDQTYDNLELVVVDDESTDDTVGLLSGHDDPRLRVLRQETNRGVAAARNRGMAAATGAYIAFLDSDDRWLPDKLARQIALFEGAPSRLGLVYCGLFMDEGAGPGAPWTPSARGDVWAEMLADNVVHRATSGVVIRREVADMVGGFDTAYPANEDHEYWARIARFFEVDFVPEPLIVYDHRVDQSERRSLNFAAKMRAREMFVERHGPDARAAGSRHVYQMDSARRHLEEPTGDVPRARWLLLKALADRPTHTPALAWLALSFVPRGQRAAWVPRLRRLRAAAPGRGAPA